MGLRDESTDFTKNCPWMIKVPEKLIFEWGQVGVAVVIMEPKRWHGRENERRPRSQQPFLKMLEIWRFPPLRREALGYFPGEYHWQLFVIPNRG